VPDEDFDGDGQTTLVESLFGTNPFSSTSITRPLPPTLSGANAVFGFSSVKGIVYQPQTTLTLGTPWTNFGTTLLGTGSSLSSTVPRPPGGQLFYRLQTITPQARLG
jgi:hypothetical protein